MSEIRTGWAYIDEEGVGHLVASEEEARAAAGMPVLFVHADDIAAFKASE